MARINVAEHMPKAYQSLVAAEGAIRAGNVPKKTLELIKIRVSQINGCAFCLNMHTDMARQAGETSERIDTLAGWREAPFFSDQERAALALAEAATRLAGEPEGVRDEVWRQAAEHYDEQDLATLVMAIAMINAWNRISVTARNPATLYERRSD